MTQPNRILFLKYCSLILLSLPLVSVAPGQEETTTPEEVKTITAESLESRSRQILEAKEAIAKERATWAEQQALFRNLISLREKEIAEIDGFTETAKSRVEEVNKKRDALTEEESARKKWRANVEKEVAALEEALNETLPLLPSPVRTKVNPALARLSEVSPADQIPLQERFRDILTILSAARDFDSKLTIDREIREFEGQRYQIDVLYLGLDHAWFVDESGTIAGTGSPTAAGWVWKADKRLVAPVRNAIQVHRRELPPSMVSLPFSTKSNSSPSSE